MGINVSGSVRRRHWQQVNAVNGAGVNGQNFGNRLRHRLVAVPRVKQWADGKEHRAQMRNRIRRQ